MTSSRCHSLLIVASLALAAIAGCVTDSPPLSSTSDDAAVKWEEFRAHPPMTWEAFRASVENAPGDPGRFIVDGDIILSGEAELRAHYDAWLEQEFDATTGGSALTVLTALGADVIWPVARRNNLTYCISNGFGARKAAVVTAMNQATTSWSSRIGVTFSYLPAQDATCTNTNNNVLFNVRLVSASFFGSAFFPNSARAGRELQLTSAAFTTTAGGRDLQGILRHETGHILGFRHEHIRITCTGEGPADSRALTSYDVNSVMHYPQCRPSGTGGYRQTARDFTGAASLYGAR
jgi:serralysin